MIKNICLGFAALCFLLIPITFAQAELAFTLGAEEQGWSDLVLHGTTFVYDHTDGSFSATNGPQATQIELGDEFGPDNEGTHYGTNGTLGGSGGGSPVLVSLSVAGTVVNGAGEVVTPGHVDVIYNAPPQSTFPGDLASDYGIDTGASLLTGEVIAVELGAQGAGTIDVYFDIDGGALQTPNTHNQEVFSTMNVGILRFSGTPGDAVPVNWDSSFTVTGTNDVLGVPEPAGSSGLVLATMLAFGSRRRV